MKRNACLSLSAITGLSPGINYATEDWSLLEMGLATLWRWLCLSPGDGDYSSFLTKNRSSHPHGMGNLPSGKNVCPGAGEQEIVGGSVYTPVDHVFVSLGPPAALRSSTAETGRRPVSMVGHEGTLPKSCWWGGFKWHVRLMQRCSLFRARLAICMYRYTHTHTPIY